jgi:hypothetical protein
MLLLVLACAPEPEAEVSFPIDLGAIQADRAGETAAATVTGAFGYWKEDTVAIVMPTAEGASCADVGTWLESGLDREFAPTEVFSPGTCVPTVKVSDYSGDEVELVSTADEPDLQVFVSIACAMEGGEWVVDDDTEGYTYDGAYYQGVADEVELALSGGDDQGDFSWSFVADDWQGEFPYEELTGQHAQGELEGAATAEWCSDMMDASIL